MTIMFLQLIDRSDEILLQHTRVVAAKVSGKLVVVVVVLQHDSSMSSSMPKLQVSYNQLVVLFFSYDVSKITNNQTKTKIQYS